MKVKVQAHKAWQQKFKTMRGWGKWNESVLVSTNDRTKTKGMYESWKRIEYTICGSIGLWTDLLSEVYTHDIYQAHFYKSLYHFHDYKFNSADADTAININILKTLKQSTGKWNRYSIWVCEQHQRKLKWIVWKVLSLCACVCGEIK